MCLKCMITAIRAITIKPGRHSQQMTQDHVWSPDDGYKIKNITRAEPPLLRYKLTL